MADNSRLVETEPERADVEALLARLCEREGEAAAQAFRKLNIHGNKLKGLLERTFNIARRFDVSSRMLWEAAAIRDILDHPTLSPLDRYKRLSQTLHQWETQGLVGQAVPALLRGRQGATDRRAPQPEALLPTRIYVDRGVVDLPRTQDILSRFPHIATEVSDDIEALTRQLPLSQGKKTWFLTRHKGKTLKRCPAYSDQYVCCNYSTFDLVSHCPLECSYCVLQSYLKTKPAIHIYTNVDEILESVGAGIDAAPTRQFRIGTGELADSLALDPLLRFNRDVIDFFARKPNAVLELKTKSPFVDHLLDLDHRGHTVIAWSINPPEVIASEEWKTASLDERLDAAVRAAGAGYPVAFHIDPIIVDTCDEAPDLSRYERLVDTLLDRVPAAAIAWVSMGTLRFSRDLKAVAQARLPKTKIYAGAFERDGTKFYYPPETRRRILGRLWQRLERGLPKERLYLCMEGKSVWQSVDASCESTHHLEARLMTPFAAA